LLVEREKLDVDLARRLVDGRRVPGDSSGIVQDGLRHDGHLVIAISTENKNYNYVTWRPDIQPYDTQSSVIQYNDIKMTLSMAILR
jgi:hypothetical protein